VTPDLHAAIRSAVGDEAVVVAADKLEGFGRDATPIGQAPELVVEATSAEQIQILLQLANRHRFAVTPRGLGTGLTGGCVPVCGGVVLSLARMNRILEIDSQDLIAVVEPGVVNQALKSAAKEKGLFYPPDPASLDTCSIGGNAATNAAGASCVKYGTTRDYVLGLEAVLPTGTLIHAGALTRKGVVGYDLARLLVGSEGTLGVITRLVLKLIPHPPAVTCMVALFPTLMQAMTAVNAVLTRGHVPCAMEFLDRHCLQLIGDLLPFEGVREAGAFLLVEVDGDPAVIDRQMERIGQIGIDCGAANVVMAPDSVKRARMWEVRREVSLRIERSSPVYVPEDVAVPIGKIAAFVEGLPAIERSHGIRVFSFGHAGDGNIHLNISAGAEVPGSQVDDAVRNLLERALSFGGTISGEHGIGLVKKRFLPLELTPASIRLQKQIKRVFDPNLILNPGKIFLDSD
jgi:D-lactate dehydrogenase (cytochrome)